MNRRVLALCSLLHLGLLVFCAGCGSILLPERERLLTEGRYDETENLVTSGMEDSSSRRSPDLARLCYSYAKLKNYNRLFSCLEGLEGNIARGDKAGYEEMIVGGTIGTFPVNDISALPQLLKAEALMDFGDFRGAVAAAKKAHDIISKTRWTTTDTFQNWPRRYTIRALGLLALAYALDGDRPDALRYLRELEAADVGFVGMVPIKKEKNLAMAKVYMALGEFDKVLAISEEGLDFFAGLGSLIVGPGTMKSYYASFELSRQFMRARALYRSGRIDEARVGYDSLLANPAIASNGEFYWPVLLDRGRMYQSSGDIRKAIQFYKHAIDVIESQRSTIHAEASRIGFAGDKQEAYYQIVSALFSERDYSGAFEYAERSKSRALVDLLASQKDFAPQGQEEKVNSLLGEIEAIEYENRVLDDSSVSPEKVNQRSARGIQIRDKLRSEVPELASLVTGTTAAQSDIQARLQSDETLIEYYYFGEDLYAFVLTKASLHAVRLDGRDLVKDMGEFRKSLEDHTSKDYREHSQKAYQRLMQPLETYIRNQNLIIVPHGVLHYIPFSVLSDETAYLIDRHAIGYLPSASVMNFLKQRKKQGEERALIFGNPDLGDPTYDLVHAGEESVAVSKNYDRSSVLLRKGATETYAKDKAGGYSLIHFATHGIFREDSPLNSGLLLAGDDRNDGILTVSELYSLRLDADLVTLSACETGLGKVNHGDDVVGLTRGFLYAGAGSVVASLWNVDDRATSRLMMDFYGQLKKVNKQEALRQAQLNTKERYRHPFFWAAFRLTGAAK